MAMPMEAFYCELSTGDQEVQNLLPIYKYILSGEDLSFRYAHLMERVCGLFFALDSYETVAVIRDSNSQSGNYDPSVIDIPLLTTALEKNAKNFAEIIGGK